MDRRVGAAVRQQNGVRFIATDVRVAELDQDAVASDPPDARQAAEQMVRTGARAEFQSAVDRGLTPGTGPGDRPQGLTPGTIGAAQAPFGRRSCRKSSDYPTRHLRENRACPRDNCACYTAPQRRRAGTLMLTAMLILILGNSSTFLGSHTFTTFRDRRARLVESLGPNTFKLIYSVIALAGFVLIVWGFSLYRSKEGIQLWTPPAGPPAFDYHADVVRLRRVRLHEPGAEPNPRLAAPPDAGRHQDLGARAPLGQRRPRRGCCCSARFWPGRSMTDCRQAARRFPRRRVSSFTRADGFNLLVGTIAYVAMIFLHPYLIGVPVLADGTGLPRLGRATGVGVQRLHHGDHGSGLTGRQAAAD